MNYSDTVTTSAGANMPRLIYGTAWKKERSAGLVEQALAAGFRGVDTACQPKHYFEPGVGEGIAAAIRQGLVVREGLYLQTKFTPLNGQDPLQIPYDANAPLAEQVGQSLQVSLDNLQTDYVDSWVLHSPLADLEQLMEVWRAMEEGVHSGAVRQLGISNCYDPKLLAYLNNHADIKPAVVQNRFYKDTGYDKAIRAFCRQHDMIYQSFWTLTANPNILASSSVKQLAAQYQRSPAQVFFRYLTQIGIVPLTGTTSVTHMREDLGIFEFELSQSECGQIEALL